MTTLLAGLLYLAPALLIAAALLRGRYPGERLLIAAVRRARAPHRAARRHGCARRTRSALPRGGQLVAARMAGRAPPRAATPRLSIQI